ncbi:acetylglutamate kinase [Fusobacterium sp. PH5-44]|uniref:acetylglutamate kinase n=1 Tax=unclassified Fusobacterium TaxID=2648384 RepID=UPI003D1A364B
MKEFENQANIITQVLPYIKEYQGEILVIKYGGNAMTDLKLKKLVMNDILLLSTVGIKVVLVHGGGPEINQMLTKTNKESKFLNGLRVTDDETMDIVQMVLAGKTNKDLVNLIGSVGGKAIGLSGVDGKLIMAKKLNEELGNVGDITNINSQVIYDIMDKGYIPIISTIACDDDGNVYNINADTAASAIAGALKAKALITMTDIKGLMRDVKDEKSLIPEVKVSEVKALIKEGIISGGMIPKIDSCVEAIRQGVEKVFIIDGRLPHSILIEVLTNAGVGTMFKGV